LDMILLFLTDMATSFVSLGILFQFYQLAVHCKGKACLALTGFVMHNQIIELVLNDMSEIKKQRFIKIAHRGASAYEPENTLRSFKRAIEMKADMIELDVRLSYDRHLVIMHDENVDRTTNGHGLVREKTLSELKKLDAGKGERIPTFEEVIDLAKGKAGFVIELKEPGTEKGVISLVKENNLIEDAFIVSFNQDTLRNARKLEPTIRTGLILFSSPDPVKLAKECLADAVAPFHDFVAKDLIEKAHSNNLILITWTVDNRKRAEELGEIGVDGIVTNKPDLI
jgi:glycerophosphoryl diester phosphodiesterase